MNRKLLYKIHKWSGLTLGLFLFLLALSGMGISFTHELLPKFYPELFQIKSQDKSLPLEVIYVKAQKYLGEEKKITNLYATEDRDEGHLFLYKTPESKFPVMLTVNPYNGEVIGEMSMIRNFFAVMLFMHANLFLGNTGSYLVGILGLILVFFAISGLYIWLPHHNFLHKLKKTFYFNGNHLPQRIHHSLGILFAIPLLLSALTGFLTVFDLSYYLIRPLRGEAPRVEELQKQGQCSLQEQQNVLKMITPNMEKNLISVHFCSIKNAFMKVSYGLHSQNFLEGYSRMVIDPKSQKILQEFNSENDPSSWNLKRLTIYPLHTGEYFGMIGRVVNFFSGLALAIIFCTGYILFLKRRIKH
jgi:sulfite reductase (NADPH) flavoprotein alpha-component